MKFDLSYTIDALPRLLEGATVTVQVALLAFAFSITLGTIIVLTRTTLNWRILNGIIAIYISFIRGTPLMIQIFLVYYVLPVTGLNLGAFNSGILAIYLYPFI